MRHGAKELAVTADDLGLSPGVNRGIAEAHRSGIVTSASIMPNMPAFDEAATLCATNPRLSVGVHITLTCGRPLRDPSRIPTLTDATGHFYTPRAFLARLLVGRIDISEAATECEAQIQAVINRNIRPMHINSHHHIHLHPPLMQAFREVAQQCGISHIRYGRPDLGGLFRGDGFDCSSLGAWRGLARMLVASFSRLCVLGPEDDADRERTLLGLPYYKAGDYVRSLVRWIERCPEGLSELVCHPGCADDAATDLDGCAEMRAEELRALTSQAAWDAVRRSGVELIPFLK